MSGIENGNLATKKDLKDTRNWVIGSFVDTSSIFNSKEIEVKWGMHPQPIKVSQGKTNSRKSLAILIQGQMIIHFPTLDKTIVLSKIGDYVSWDKHIPHTYDIIKDTIIITIRWFK